MVGLMASCPSRDSLSPPMKVDFHQPETPLNENQAALGLPRLAEEGVRFERGAAFGGITGLS